MSTDTAPHAKSIQGEQQPPEKAWATFNGTRVEIEGPFPRVGDVFECTVRFRCKYNGDGEVGDKVRHVLTLKAVEVVPGDITKAEDLGDPKLPYEGDEPGEGQPRDDVSDGE